MGEHEGWAEPSGLLPSGLLPSAGRVIRVLDSDRWITAEERTAELIARIQPNQPSEELRNAVGDYVQRLIMKCFPCQVFTFGSVPLKTYLPDGDIDLTAFSNNQNLKESWANQVRDMLQNEEKNEHAEFRVKEVQYIQAEVKLVKCLVENIVVDISFNQLGGLCTLCFLEEVDNLINQNHLFKRSIILIKAWCYYESRILGAHHGLISTYALETLVLYIFHVFNNSFAGPLEVLYRFLEFFSNFDWSNFCVSLWGPVPITSLPDINAEPPRKDSGDLLLSKGFLDSCSSAYAVFPGGMENQGHPFVSKHFNVIDPLRVNNNLGRSVSKGNFFRIRSAFAFGAKTLGRLLECPKENLVDEVNNFFTNTWDRYGSGQRPDTQGNDVGYWRSSTPEHLSESENDKNNTGKKLNDSSSGNEMNVDGTRIRSVASQHGHYSSGSMHKTPDLCADSQTQSQKNHGNLNSSRVLGQVGRESTSNWVDHTDKGQSNLKSDHSVNDIQGRFIFARTRSSPELTEVYGDTASQIRHNRVPESAKTSLRQEAANRRKNNATESLPSHSGRCSNDDSLSVRPTSSNQSLDVASESISGSNNYHHDSSFDALNEELSTMGTQGMHQDEQDLVNLMAATSLHGFNGQVSLPFNLASGHLPFPISPSFMASTGYAQRNLPGFIPSNLPLIDPSFSNMQFHNGLVSPQLTHYYAGIGLNPSSDDAIDRINENICTMEVNSGDVESDLWQDLEVGCFESDNGNPEMLQSDNKRQSTMSNFNAAPSWASGGSGSSMRVQQNQNKEKRGSQREHHLDNFHVQENRGSEVYFEERSTSSRFSCAPNSNSARSRTSSESSWDGSSTKSSKSTRERRGKKVAPTESTVGYGKGKIMSEHVSNQFEDDDHEWNQQSNLGAELAERSPGGQSVASLHVSRHHMPGFEDAQTSGSDSIMPMAPMLIGPGSRQRMADNSGVITFYPTGPPVPFVTMLPVYNIRPETGASDSSIDHFVGEEGLENNDSSQNYDTTVGLEQSDDLTSSASFRVGTSVEASDEHKPDILHSDFASHWQNLQYGRYCQNPRYPGPLIYNSSVGVPPVCLQGRFPWDGPGRPHSGNINLFSHLMSYGPRLVPVAPVQSVSTRPPNVYQHYTDDVPRYRSRSGTGTYLPNPKVSARDKHTSGTRRGNYNYEKNDSHSDREGNCNVNSKSRAGRGYNRNQNEKSNSRSDRLSSSSEGRTDRSWGSYRNESFTSYQSQNGPLHTTTSQSGPPNVAYGMYPFPAMNPSGVSSNGPTVPPVVMLYPFEHNSSFGSHGEQLEFGSLGPIAFSGMTEQSHPSDGNRARGAFEEYRFHGAADQRSPSDQPSSPNHHNHRRI